MKTQNLISEAQSALRPSGGFGRVEARHDVVGKTLRDTRGLDLGAYYPVVNERHMDARIVGLADAEGYTVRGYVLDPKLQAMVPLTSLSDDELEVVIACKEL